jgi:hypothetical protein
MFDGGLNRSRRWRRSKRSASPQSPPRRGYKLLILNDKTQVGTGLALDSAQDFACGPQH